MGMLKGLFKSPKMPTPQAQAPAATETDSSVDTAEQDAARGAQKKKGLAASILAGEGGPTIGGHNPLRQPKKALKGLFGF